MILSDMLSNMIGQMLGEIFGETIEEKFERRAVLRTMSTAILRAEQQFAHSYRPHDPELVDALTTQTRFADLPSVQAALRALLTRPLDDVAPQVAALRQSFNDVLPQRLDRERVDAAVQSFLDILGREVLYIPQLQQLYALGYQRRTAEQTWRLAEQATTIAEGIHALRADMQQLAALPASQPLALITSRQSERSRPWHNLPQRNYAQFVGRQTELEQLQRLLLPHPRSRIFVVTLDGIGGVGKSALALELAHQYRERYDAVAPDERFERIVWASAKRTLLTAQGIQQRRPNFGTLDDLFREIAYVLDQPAMLQVEQSQRRGAIERALSAQRTLLIIDNLETIDDEELLSFLRELPDPTKAIVTTRHRIDIAYAIRLTGMPREDALALMEVEAANRAVDLPPAAQDDLFRRSGGVPLAIVWSIGLMSVGHSVEAVLRRLGSGQSDIARFCFAESVAHIHGHDAERLLLALALFERSVGRAMLGAVAGLGDDSIGRDDGLAELLRLSLANQRGDRFKLLPLTQSFALEALAKQSELERELRERWARELLDLARPFAAPHWQHPGRQSLQQEGNHLATLANWAQQQARPDVLLPILPALFAYFDVVGQWGDLLTLAEVGLELARLTGDLVSVRYLQNKRSWVLSQQGRHTEAEQAHIEALEVAVRRGEAIWEAEVLISGSQLYRRQHRFDDSQRCCDRVVHLMSRLTDSERPYVEADLQVELGKIARDQEDWATAQRCFLAARSVFRLDLENPVFNIERAWGAFGQLAYVTHRLGDLETAAQMYHETIEALQGIGSRGYLCTIRVRFANLEAQRGNQAAALAHVREALEWSRKLGMVQEQMQAEELMAGLEPEIE